MKNMLIATAALMAGTAALAQTGQTAPAPVAPPAPMAHPMADKVMTRDEAVTMVRDHFARMDADKNGSITTEEAMKGHRAMGDRVKPRRFAHGEGGGPRTMRFEKRDPNAAFDRLDADKNGWIGRDEFAKGHEERIERRIEIREKRKEARAGKAGDRHQFRMHRMGGLGGGRMIVMADSNKDGQITLAEAQAKALEHFDRLDSNRDGQVTPEERRAGRQMIIKQRIEDKKTAS